MELGLSLGEAPAVADAGRPAPELVLGLGVGAGRGGDQEGDKRRREAAAGAGWWAAATAASPEPSVRLSLVSSHGLRWPSDTGRSEATARGFDVNRMPSVAVGTELEEEEDDPAAAAALSSSPNDDSGGSFPFDLSAHGGHLGTSEAAAEAALAGGGERSSSRASDDDEGASARKKLRLSKDQSAFLEESFKEHSTLNPKQKVALAKQLNLRPRQVEVWFQNRRARTKLKQTEVDCEYLKRCCETLTEENRRLHKELSELRALKTAQPFYMHLPATTLSMCPSCERVASNPAAAASSSASKVISKAAAAPEQRTSSAFAALFASPRGGFPLAAQTRPPPPPAASNCL
ncbi:homeobox-leucine zipper protein HOX27 [Brachypodium distachyon]|uniref:Homeobox domain-containing protein n=1 Tax=Brachypodium distachyon TaxID=15368 RepID=I1I7P9_BRADI|nr:homeobox-leucine zipper protein HOX27 [Brachypodium distachyon]KQJ98582.1 hypothetical protein BRADI_3g37810v3 [Brachypodium distachyon]|eukprot:XP_003574599.1 homeobox-leucine zipper protein HOX27 [Brachypodium distachyon]